MARLILNLDGQVLAEYNMQKERYTVGRLPDNATESGLDEIRAASVRRSRNRVQGSTA